LSVLRRGLEAPVGLCSSCENEPTRCRFEAGNVFLTVRCAQSHILLPIRFKGVRDLHSHRLSTGESPRLHIYLRLNDFRAANETLSNHLRDNPSPDIQVLTARHLPTFTSILFPKTSPYKIFNQKHSYSINTFSWYRSHFIRICVPIGIIARCQSVLTFWPSP